MKTLRTFANWAIEPTQVTRWMGAAPIESRTGQAKELKQGGSQVDVVYREGPLQIERIALAPHTVLKTHRHPGVDSYEYHVCGDVEFWLGRRVFHQSAMSPFRLVPVSQHAFHSGIVGESGVTFLSIQYWGEIPPSSVQEVWETKDE